MNSAEVFGWACCGGAVVGVVLYVLPRLIHILITGSGHFTKADWLVAFGIVVLLTLIAGVIALIPNHVGTRGQAITLGLGVQAALRGIVEAGKDAFRPLAHRQGA